MINSVTKLNPTDNPGMCNPPEPGAVNVHIASELRKTYGNETPVLSIKDSRVQRLRDVYAFGRKIYIGDPEKLLGEGWKMVHPICGSENPYMTFELSSADPENPSQALSFNRREEKTILESYHKATVSSPVGQVITMDKNGKITSKTLNILH